MNGSRILLADDNFAMLHMARRVLSSEFTVAASVRNGTAVLQEVPIIHPDVIVLDIAMGEPNGIEVARQLKKSGCSAKILFLTVHQNVEYLQAALEAGGSAYVIKSRLHQDLLPAVRAICSNCLFVSPTIRLDDGNVGHRDALAVPNKPSTETQN